MKTIHYTCHPKEGKVKSCSVCDVKGFCPAYSFIMDLTACRDICPLDRTMEKCSVNHNTRRENPCPRGVEATTYQTITVKNRQSIIDAKKRR